MPRRAAPQPLSVFLVVAILAPLAGCGEPEPEAGNTFQRPIQFAQQPWAAKVGDRIDWHFTIENTGTTRVAGLTLLMDVSFNNAALAPDHAETEVPDMGPGARHALRLSTPYHGPGDYTGRAEVRQGAFLATGQPLFFEHCDGMLDLGRAC